MESNTNTQINNQNQEKNKPANNSDLEKKEEQENKNNWFTPQHWLTDSEIDWALEQVINQFPYEQISQFKILELTQFMFAKETSGTKDIESSISFPTLLSEFTGFNGKLVFIPINNPDFHWSLLVYEKSAQTFYHWDTLTGSPNHGYIKPLVRDLLQQLQQNNNPDLDQHLVLKDEIKQPNTWDCGVAVIEIVRRIMERYDISLENIRLGEFNFPQTRNEWKDKWKNIVNKPLDYLGGEEKINKKNWKENIYPFKSFTEELTNEWINCGFDKKETREWLENGLQPNDAGFAQWLRDIKVKDAEWFSDCGQEEELIKEFQKYLISESTKINKSLLERMIDSSEDEEFKKLLASKKWLNNQDIDNSLSQMKTSTLHVLPAHQFHYARELMNKTEDKVGAYIAFSELLIELDENKYELVFIPVRQNEFDWSLLIYETSNKNFHHYDNLNGYGGSYEYIKPLVQNLLLVKGIHSSHWQNHLLFQHNIKPQQGMENDCGASLITCAAMINQYPFLLIDSVSWEQFLPFTHEEEKNASDKADESITTHESWKDIHSSFTPELQEKWEELWLNCKQAKKWIDAGFRPEDFSFIGYLKDQGFAVPNQFLNSDEIADLKRRFQKWESKIEPKKNSIQQWLENNYPDKSITTLNINNKELEGELDLSSFPGLTNLQCRNNKLTSIDLSNNKKLTVIDCSDNQLTTIPLFPCPEKVTTLVISNNSFLEQNLSFLDRFTNLKHLFINGNSFVKVYEHLEKHKNLVLLGIDNLKLGGSLVIKDFPYLKGIYLSDNRITELKLINTPNLETLECQNNQLSKLAVNYLSNLKLLNCSNNKKIKSLNCEWLVRLEELSVNNNNLSNLDVTNCPHLRFLKCDNNQLAKLNLSKNIGLIGLDCSDNQLTSLDLPLDYDKINFDFFNIKNNPNLVITKKKFLKKIPIYVEKKIEAISQAQFQQMIEQKAKIPGEVKQIEFCPTWWNPNCVLIINKSIRYGLRLVVYEPPEKKIPEVFKVFTISPSTGYDWDKVLSKMDLVKEKLNSDHPILALGKDISLQEVIKKEIISKLKEMKTEDYLKFLDIVWRPMDIPGYHVGVYLGNNQISHVNTSRFDKVDKLRDSKKNLGARTDKWENFLDGKNKVIRHHFIVPCKRPWLILEQISRAIVSNYAKGEYSLLGKNCEHFATLAVCGVPFSIQADKIKLLFSNYDLEKELVKSSKMFAELASDEQLLTELARNREFRVEELNNIRNRLPKEERVRIDEFIWSRENYDDKFLWNIFLENVVKILQKWLSIEDIRTLLDLKQELPAIENYLVKCQWISPRKVISSFDLIGWLKNLTELELRNKNLTGHLNLSTLSGLELLIIAENRQLTSLDLSNNNKLEMLGCPDNKLTKLVLNKNLKTLACQQNQLSRLDLNNCSQLQELVCYTNQLIKLDLSQNKKLQRLVCENNQLTELDFSNNHDSVELRCHTNKLTSAGFLTTFSHPEKITHLSIGNNPYPEQSEQSLEIFRSFFNLEVLHLDGAAKFTGSLAALQDLNKLSLLIIGGTNLDSDLENLPNKLRTIYALIPEMMLRLRGFERTEGRDTKYSEIISPKSEYCYDYQEWKKFIGLASLVKKKYLEDRIKNLETLINEELPDRKIEEVITDHDKDEENIDLIIRNCQLAGLQEKLKEIEQLTQSQAKKVLYRTSLYNKQEEMEKVNDSITDKEEQKKILEEARPEEIKEEIGFELERKLKERRNELAQLIKMIGDKQEEITQLEQQLNNFQEAQIQIPPK